MTSPLYLKIANSTNDGPLAAFTALIEEKGNIDSFGPVRRLNLFLGANNSGKSRLMRALFALPQYTCIETSAQGFIRNVAEGLTAIANEDALEGHFVAAWHFRSAPIRGYPSVKREELLELSKEFGRLAERPGLLMAFTSALRAFKPWIDGTLNGIDNAELVRFLNSKCQGEIKDIKIPDNSDHTASDEERAWVGHLANHPFVRIAWAAKHLQPIELRTSRRTLPLAGIKPFEDLLKSLVSAISRPPVEAVYIPILRTAHVISDAHVNGEDLYLATIKRFYGLTTTAKGGEQALRKEVFTGMGLYRSFLENRGGRRELRLRFQQFEEFLSKTFFGGRTVDIVSQHASPEDGIDARHVKVTIDTLERELHHLGDGIQSLIILLYPMFMAEPRTWFFIDEPELHLHPGLQRVFIEALMNNAILRQREFRYFFTTHSNHFFDPIAAFSGEVSVFSMSQEEGGKFSICCRHAPSVTDLNLLGVRNASVLLTNCTIWVEGVVDRLYIRAFLQLFAASQSFEFREDIHYAFLEYGGANIAHYTDESDDPLTKGIEPIKLSNRALVLADFDFGKDAKHSSRADFFNARSIEYITTHPCTEIENCLGERVFREALAPGRLWPKKIEGLDVMTVSFESEKLQTRRMGSYLQELIQSQISGFMLVEPQSPKGDGKGVTLPTGVKIELAEQVCKLVASGKLRWDMLSVTAREITEKIALHIRRNNAL